MNHDDILAVCLNPSPLWNPWIAFCDDIVDFCARLLVVIFFIGKLLSYYELRMLAKGPTRCDEFLPVFYLSPTTPLHPPTHVLFLDKIWMGDPIPHLKTYLNACLVVHSNALFSSSRVASLFVEGVRFRFSGEGVPDLKSVGWKKKHQNGYPFLNELRNDTHKCTRNEG